MVKLTLDQLVVKYMPFNMNNATAKDPILKIVLGEFEVTTSSFEKSGTGKNDFIFPETFELQVDINAYRDGELMLHVEIYDQVNEEFVYIGNGTSPLIGLINLSTVNQSVGFSIDIDPYEPKLSRERTCVIEMSGRIDYQENEYLTDELSLKQAEMDALQVKFDEFVSGSKAMEAEMDDALQAAQQKVLKLSKKNGDLTEKYNELTETYNSLQSAYEELNEQLNNLQSVTVATETYNELTETYNSLTTEYERMQTELQEAVVERSNVEADYTNRYNELTETYNNLVTEYESLQEQYEQALKDKDDKKEEENAGLVEQYNSLTEVYNSLTEEYERVTEESQQVKVELQRRIDNDSSINNYEQLIADLEGKVRELSSSRDKLSINLQQSEKDKSMLTTDNNSLKSQLKEATEQKNATIKALDEEKQRLEATTSDASQLRSQLSTKIASLEAELQLDKRKIEELLVEKKRLEDLPPPPAPAPVIVVEAPTPLPPPPVQVVTQEVVHTTVVRPYITMTSTVFDTDFYQSLQNSSNAADRLLTSLVEAGDSERLKVALVNSVQVYHDLKRRNLTNLYKLSKLRNTVHVCCRVRPLSDDELKDSNSNGNSSSNGNGNGNSNSCIEIVSDQLLAVTKGSELIPFELDTVWGYDAHQADVFEDVEPLIAAVASGSDASIISYGGSKAGKSFTMSGFGQHVGVFYRSILKLFDLLEFKKSQSSKNSIDYSIFGFSVDISVLCIQNEEITDLIALLESGKTKSSFKTKVKATLALAKSSDERGGPYEVIIPNKVVKAVSSAAEAMLLFTRAVQGISDRNTGHIEQNAHLLLQINVKQYKDAKSLPFQSTVTLADLASFDDRYPAEHVSNQSITAITNVLHTVCSSSGSTPYTSSSSSSTCQLAIVLSPTLGGNAKSLVIINVCPSVHAIDKTLVDLQFASKLFSYSASQQQQQGSSSSKTTSTTTTTSSSLSSSILLTTSIQTVTLQQKLDTVSEELALTKEKCVMIEDNFHKTRDAAKALVQQLFDHSKLLVDKFQYEQEQNKVLSNNFELLSKNHQYTVSELQQQIAINEKLLATIKAAGFDN